MKADNLPLDWQLRLVQLLAVPGIMLSFYLWLFHSGALIAVCSGSGWDDCGLVSGPDAAYSSIGPVPVALIGLLGYVVIFLVIWLSDWLPLLYVYLPELMVGLTGVAFLFSLVLTVLEIFVIHALCRYCVVSAVIATIMLILSISYLRSINKLGALSTPN
jgi:uncharacterized membrane protein